MVARIEKVSASMEILKKFKSWLSFKKETTPRTNTYQQNEEKNTNGKKRSVKRNAEPISEEESVRRKCHRTETIKLPTKTELGKDKALECNTSSPKGTYKAHFVAKDNVKSATPPNENHMDDESEENTSLTDYEVKTIGSIHEIREKCERFDREIESFTDITGSRQFLYVDDNLQSHIEKLDKIDAKESTNIRKERKSAVRYICLLIDRLEVIAKRNQEQLVTPKQLKAAPISREQFLEGKKEE